MTQIQAIATIALLLVSSACARHSATRASGFLTASTDLQPQKVAMTLAEVESEWKSQATAAAECNVEAAGDAKRCAMAREAFLKSCSTVVSAIVQASGGNRGSVKEYMGDVCRQDVLQVWQKEHCGSFAEVIDGGMTDDNYDNRMNFDTSKLCSRFWQRFSDEQEQRLKKEKAEREAEEKRLAEERAEAEKKAAEEAAAEQKRQQEAAEKRKAEEAKRQAEEAKKQAEEAERQAQEAKKQAEEAKKQALEKAEQKKKEAEEKKKQADEKKKQAEAKKTEADKVASTKPLAQNSTKVQEKEKTAAPVSTSAKGSTAKKAA